MLIQSKRHDPFRLQSNVDRYNSVGSANENSHDELLKFVNEMKAEDERHVREGLTEDELEQFQFKIQSVSGKSYDSRNRQDVENNVRSQDARPQARYREWNAAGRKQLKQLFYNRFRNCWINIAVFLRDFSAIATNLDFRSRSLPGNALVPRLCLALH